MNKICPLCQTMYDDSLKFCSNCGTLLTDNSTSANNTFKQKTEVKSEPISQIRTEAEQIMSKCGCIYPSVVDQLHALAWQLGVSSADFKKIITEVRSIDKDEDKGYTQLSAEDASLIANVRESISTYDYNCFKSLFPYLTDIAERTDNDKVQYLYYLSTAIFEADKCMKRYEDAIDHKEPYDTYWGTFWATVCFLQFVNEEREDYASRFFNLFDPNHFHRPKDDKYLLEALYNLLHKERKADPKDALDKITGDLSSQLKPFLRALECYTSRDEADCLEVRFYMNEFLSRFCLDEELHRKFIELSYEEKPAEESKEKQKALQNLISILIKNAESNTLILPIKKSLANGKEALRLYEKALKAPENERIYKLKEAAEHGSTQAIYDIAEYYCNSEDYMMEKILYWYKEGARYGDPKCQCELGCWYLDLTGNNDLDQNEEKGLAYLKMAVEQNEPTAYSSMAYYYFLKGKDYQNARNWALKAAESNEPNGLRIMYQIYKNGLGVEQNENEASKYLKKLADTGDEDAQEALQNQKKDLENEEEFELTDIRLETDGKNKLFIYCSCVAPTLKGFEGKTVTLDCHILVNGKEIRKEGTLIDNGIAGYKIKKFVVETDARELSLPVRGDNTLIYHLKVTYTPADKLLSKPQVLASTGANVATVYYLYNIFSSNKMIIK